MAKKRTLVSAETNTSPVKNKSPISTKEERRGKPRASQAAAKVEEPETPAPAEPLPWKNARKVRPKPSGKLKAKQATRSENSRQTDRLLHPEEAVKDAENAKHDDVDLAPAIDEVIPVLREGQANVCGLLRCLPSTKNLTTSTA